MRWIIRIFMALVVFAAMAVGALFLIPAEKVAALAAREFSKLTGRELVIEGSVKPSLWPVLGVRTGPISVANAAWSDEGPLLAAQSMEIAVDMASVLSGDLRITGLELTAPEFVLERSAEGLANWDFTAAGGSGGTAGPDTPGAGRPFVMDHAVITGGSFRYIDHARGTETEMLGIEAVARLPDFNGAAELSLSGLTNGQQIEAKASIGAFGSFLSGRLVPVTVQATVGASRLSFDGQVANDPLAAEGKLDAELKDMSALFALAGMAPPSLPPGLGARSAAVKGAVTLTSEGSAHLRGGVITLDGNVLSGDADLVNSGERPKLSAKLVAGDLVLASGAADSGAEPEDGGESGAAPARGWSTEPLDVSGLSALDATVALSADSIDFGSAKSGALRVLTTLERSRVVFDLRQLQAYGGSLTGEFVINGRGGLSVGGNLAFAGIALQPMLADLAKYERLTGTGDISLQFLGVGNSMADLMQGLSGTGALSLRSGELQGVDIPGMLRHLDPSYAGDGTRTTYDAVTASFAIDGGVLTNDDLQLDAPGLRATGEGVVGIGARTLDYRIRPEALANADGTGGARVPLRIEGSWEDPRFSLDLETIAQERLEAEAAELEEKAKAKLAEELGLEAQEGESLEDAAKRELEQAIEDEAARALERLLGNGD